MSAWRSIEAKWIDQAIAETEIAWMAAREPFASLDQELEAYWQQIESLYVREEA
jgi:hypothetical protein